jgi:hypothetical protein
MKNGNKLLLLLILLVSLFIRSYSLLSSPPSLFSDEVDAAYQAYVFNQCGTDYHGNKLPTHFQSFADNRTSAYIYSIALTQLLTGPTAASARIPSIIFGTLSVLAIFLLVKSKYSIKTAFIAAFLLAVSPWAIHYSRTGFEVSGMLFFYIMALYYFELFKKSKLNRHLILSAIFFVITPYYYSTAKLFTLITGVVLAIRNYKLLLGKGRIKKTIISLIPALIISIPLILSTIKGESGYRFSYISIFSDPTISQQVDAKRLKISHTRSPYTLGQQPTLIDKLFINKYTLTAKLFTHNYLASFSNNFLFVSGDENLRHSSGKGLFYLIDALFLLFAFKIFLKKKSRDILILLLLSPIPFSLTRDSTSPHATRLILMLPFLIIFLSLSINSLIKKYSYLLYPIIFIYLISFFNFFHHYLFIYPQESSHQWHKNIGESIESLKDKTGDYQNIYFSNNPEPILPFFLFYTQFIPKNCNFENTFFHESLQEFSGITIENKYHFGLIEWPQVKDKNGKSLFLVSYLDIETIKNNISNPHIIDKISSDYETASDYYLIKQEN